MLLLPSWLGLWMERLNEPVLTNEMYRINEQPYKKCEAEIASHHKHDEGRSELSNYDEVFRLSVSSG